MADFQNWFQLASVGFAEDDAHANTGAIAFSAGQLSPTVGSYSSIGAASNVWLLNPSDLPSIGYLRWNCQIGVLPNSELWVRVWDITNATSLGAAFVQGPRGLWLPNNHHLRSGTAWMTRPSSTALLRFEYNTGPNSNQYWYWHHGRVWYQRYQ